MRLRLPVVIPLLLLAAGVVAQTPVDLPQPVPQLTRLLPFSLIGKLIFSQGDEWFQGSGTVIRPSAVLTAAHNLWDADRGFSTDVIFERAREGDAAAGTAHASRVYVLGGYRDSARRDTAADPRAFAQDLGIIVFPQPVAAGAAAGWWSDPAALLNASPTQALGYGAQIHDGTHLLLVATGTAFDAVSSTFFENPTVGFEAGMSGGPLFARTITGDLLIAGVVVARAEDAQGGGGIRALDAAAAQFIRTYAR